MKKTSNKIILLVLCIILINGLFVGCNSNKKISIDSPAEMIGEDFETSEFEEYGADIKKNDDDSITLELDKDEYGKMYSEMMKELKTAMTDLSNSETIVGFDISDDLQTITYTVSDYEAYKDSESDAYKVLGGVIMGGYMALLNIDVDAENYDPDVIFKNEKGEELEKVKSSKLLGE